MISIISTAIIQCCYSGHFYRCAPRFEEHFHHLFVSSLTIFRALLKIPGTLNALGLTSQLPKLIQ